VGLGGAEAGLLDIEAGVGEDYVDGLVEHGVDVFDLFQVAFFDLLFGASHAFGLDFSFVHRPH
jgi:hypothetical protein